MVYAICTLEHAKLLEGFANTSQIEWRLIVGLPASILQVTIGNSLCQSVW